MSSPLNRRNFVAGVGSFGLLTGLGDFDFLGRLPSLSAAQVQPNPQGVQVNQDIEPLVRLIEDTPRNQLIGEAALRVRAGASYLDLLAALMLAGVRRMRPRPVGFQFHAVLVVNSAHLASLAARDQDRWLPLFWAIDNFKESQARNQPAGWVMPALADDRLPAGPQARERFIQAMDNWDEEGADTAAAAFARSASASDVYELFWRYGCRDFRDIGHKAIYVANSWRTLQTIGWRHAEPIVRSLAFALLEHEGTNPAQRNDARDMPYRDNLQRITRIRDNWLHGRVTEQGVTDFLAALRTTNPTESCNQAVQMLGQEVSPNCLWDALFLRAGELLMQQPGIVGLHCVTTINALYFGYQTTANNDTRKLLLLQAAAFLPLFREAMAGRGRLNENLRIDTLEPMDLTGQGPEAVQEILADISQNRLNAARKTLSLLREDSNIRAEALVAGARQLVFSKGNNAHDYKFSSAALEDFYNTSPHWRNRLLATSMFNLHGSRDASNSLIERIQTALSAT
jgi:hypothetical protein